MNSLRTWVKTYIRELLIRKKFPSSVIYSGANVDPTSVLGEHSVLFQDVLLMNSSLGAYSYLQSGSVVYNTEIGKFCSIASGVNIGFADHPMHMVSTSPVFYDNSQPLPKFLINERVFTGEPPLTIIGADVWIGQGVMIKAGVKIGVGAVIGAGAVVTKDIPPYMIAAGNPCRFIRPRFNADICQKLLDTHWWELEDITLQHLAHYFRDPILLCEFLSQATD